MPAPMTLTGRLPGPVAALQDDQDAGNEELILSGARLGNRQPLILKLSPMDTVDYEAWS